jgi:hypothetical protein
VTGIQKGSWKESIQAANNLLAPYFEAETERLTKAAESVVENAIKAVTDDGCSIEDYWCETMNNSFSYEVLQRAKENLSASDFWGNRYTIGVEEYSPVIAFVTAGPDEEIGTDDDHTLNISVSEIGLSTETGEVFMPEVNMDMAGGMMEDDGMDWDKKDAVDLAATDEEEEGGQEEPRVRKDFPETLYVNPSIITESNGVAAISVPMADSITEWRVSTLANSMNGKLGSSTSGITVFQEFFADINFPATLTRGDEISFPIAVYNYMDEAETVDIELSADTWFTALGETTATVELQPGEVAGLNFPVRVDEVGLKTLTVTAIGSHGQDAVQRAVLVEPDGKEIATANSGTLGTGATSHDVIVPAEAVDGSEKLYVEIYPAFLSQVVEGMDSILQTPNGCFEQTTSSTWPNVLATSYMQEAGVITPEIQMKAESLISTGYQRLLTFEHTGGGFSWFGEPGEPNVSVTAFGVMEFADMAKVATVDSDMLDRTVQWLVGKQSANGSWEGAQTEFFSFSQDTVRNTAFVIMALDAAEYQGPELNKGVDYITANLTADEKDPYTLGLVVGALSAAAPNDPMTKSLFDELDDMKQEKDGAYYWDSSGTQTNFYGSGNDASVTATAIIAHGMLSAGSHLATAQGAIQYLTQSKDANGNFGSTNATVWALRALLLSATKGTDGAVGTASVTVDGELFDTISLTEQSADMMITVDLTSKASEGSHTVGIGFSGEGKMSYNLVNSYHIPWVDAPEADGPLSVTVSYDKQSFPISETVTADVQVKNNTASNQNMILVTLGIAPGFSVMTEDLDVYQTNGVLAKYELTAKQLTLYVAELKGGVTQQFSYRLKATMPVKASDGGAKVNPYYEPDKVSSDAAQILEVTAD